MPTASDTTINSVRPGARRNVRSAYRISCRKSLIVRSPKRQPVVGVYAAGRGNGRPAALREERFQLLPANPCQRALILSDDGVRECALRRLEIEDFFLD